MATPYYPFARSLCRYEIRRTCYEQFQNCKAQCALRSSVAERVRRPLKVSHTTSNFTSNLKISKRSVRRPGHLQQILWNGLVEWNGGMEYWNSGMPYFIHHLNKAYVYPDADQAVSVSSPSHEWAIKAIQSERLSSGMREVAGKAARVEHNKLLLARHWV